MIIMHTGVLHFSWGHTTESMCVGYLTSYHNEPTVSCSSSHIIAPLPYYDLYVLAS